MKNCSRHLEKRNAIRIDIELRIEIMKIVSDAGFTNRAIVWREEADLKNISFSGAYFHYSGRNPVDVGDTIMLDMNVPVQIAFFNVSGSVQLKGYSEVVRVVRKKREKICGIGVRFLKPLKCAAGKLY